MEDFTIKVYENNCFIRTIKFQMLCTSHNDEKKSPENKFLMTFLIIFYRIFLFLYFHSQWLASLHWAVRFLKIILRYFLILTISFGWAHWKGSNHMPPNMTHILWKGTVHVYANMCSQTVWPEYSLFAYTIYKLWDKVYLDSNEMSGRVYFCTCPQTILLSEKENRICTLFTHR